ncbi:hypothetical protein ACHAPU_010971 [Fusarium lateritium]
MSANSLDHSNVDPLNQEARRHHMQTVFAHLGIPSPEDYRMDATEALCELANTWGLRNLSTAYFEYDLDMSIWNSIRKLYMLVEFYRTNSLVVRYHGLLDQVGLWPWGQKPNACDLRNGHSVKYREWRVGREMTIEEVNHNWASKHEVSGDGQPLSVSSRQKAAEVNFAAEKLRIGAFKTGRSLSGETPNGDSGVGTPAELDVTPLLCPNFPLLVRNEFRAHTELPSPCPLVPIRKERDLIWRGLGLNKAEAPFPGSFELTIPSWMDFHDLVYGNDGCLFCAIKREGLVDNDLVIGWKVLNNRPVSLIVGPNPTVAHNPRDRRLWIRVRNLWWRVTQWLLEVYDGRPLRLRDYLLIMQSLEVELGPTVSLSDPSQLNIGREIVPSESAAAAFRAEAKRHTFDLWMPEIYAILTEPRHLLIGLFDEWIDRLGVEIAPQRLDAVRDAWALYEPGVAWKWCLEKRLALNTPSDTVI